MVSVNIYFQVHQPKRLARFSIIDTPQAQNAQYFDEEKNKKIIEKVAKKCYIPTNQILLEKIRQHDGRFKISYSTTGVFLEQCEQHYPQVIESFQKLAETGSVEFLNETYYHSLSSLFPEPKEFENQVKMHQKKIRQLFGQKPSVFRNTEAIYDNRIAKIVEKLGYKATLTEGIEWVLGWRSPDYVYKAKDADIRLLFRNYGLSDDLAYRFGARWWKEWPLTAEKFAGWISKCTGQCVNLFMDYETFGEHHWQDSGIFEFLKAMPDKILQHQHVDFATPTELLSRYEAMDEIDVPHTISWADMERDTSAWLGNDMQRHCFQKIIDIGKLVEKTGRKQDIDNWRRIQSSDHLYYLCTKWLGDGDVHNYFSPYESPYEAFINLNNILTDFERRLEHGVPNAANS